MREAIFKFIEIMVVKKVEEQVKLQFDTINKELKTLKDLIENQKKPQNSKLNKSLLASRPESAIDISDTKIEKLLVKKTNLIS